MLASSEPSILDTCAPSSWWSSWCRWFSSRLVTKLRSTERGSAIHVSITGYNVGNDGGVGKSVARAEAKQHAIDAAKRFLALAQSAR